MLALRASDRDGFYSIGKDEILSTAIGRNHQFAKGTLYACANYHLRKVFQAGGSQGSTSVQDIARAVIAPSEPCPSGVDVDLHASYAHVHESFLEATARKLGAP